MGYPLRDYLNYLDTPESNCVTKEEFNQYTEYLSNAINNLNSLKIESDDGSDLNTLKKSFDKIDILYHEIQDEGFIYISLKGKGEKEKMCVEDLEHYIEFNSRGNLISY